MPGPVSTNQKAADLVHEAAMEEASAVLLRLGTSPGRPERGGSRGAAGAVRPQRSRAREARVAAPAVGRRPQPAGDPADRPGDPLLSPPAISRAGTVMLLMVVLGVSLRFVQETKADTAAAKLKAMISVTATVVRDGQPKEIPLQQLVPGDVVKLSAGDMIPGDVRLSAGQGPVHHPGHAHRRIHAGGENRRARPARQRLVHRAHEHLLPRHQRGERRGHGGHRRHRRADLFRQDGQQPGRPADRHGL